MTMELQLNTRMPYMKFNWLTHEARAGKLTMAERGLYDSVRYELWKFLGCKVPRSSVEAVLRIKRNSANAKALDLLIERGLLKVDSEGLLFDEVQVEEFAKALHKSEVNSKNGASGGRPRQVQPVSQQAGATPTSGADIGDF